MPKGQEPLPSKFTQTPVPASDCVVFFGRGVDPRPEFTFITPNALVFSRLNQRCCGTAQLVRQPRCFPGARLEIAGTALEQRALQNKGAGHEERAAIGTTKGQAPLHEMALSTC